MFVAKKLGVEYATDIHVLLFSSFFFNYTLKDLLYVLGGVFFVLFCFFYCCQNKYHKLTGLKKHRFIMSQLCMSKVWVSSDGFSAPSVARAKSRWQPIGFFLGGFRKNLLWIHSSCSRNPEPCGCRTDVAISLLAVSEEMLLFPGDLPPVPALGALHVSISEQAHIKSFSCLESLCFSLLPHRYLLFCL